MLVKICGLKYPDNVIEIQTLVPDWVGFIFYYKSKRFLGEDFDWSLIPRNGPKRLAVCVNPERKWLCSLIDSGVVDGVQLHGDESPHFVEDLRRTFSELTILKAFQVNSDTSFEALFQYKPWVDYYLFDTASKGYGGSGQTFNWRVLEKHQSQIDHPFFLSGGLSIENVDSALALRERLELLVGLDFNSKLELEPGIKSVDLVKQVLSRVRGGASLG